MVHAHRLTYVCIDWQGASSPTPNPLPPQVCRGLPVASALEQTVEELRAAGGSFKQLRTAQAAAARGARREAVLQLKSMPLSDGFDFDLIDGLEA